MLAVVWGSLQLPGGSRSDPVHALAAPQLQQARLYKPTPCKCLAEEAIANWDRKRFSWTLCPNGLSTPRHVPE